MRRKKGHRIGNEEWSVVAFSSALGFVTSLSETEWHGAFLYDIIGFSPHSLRYVSLGEKGYGAYIHLKLLGYKIGMLIFPSRLEMSFIMFVSLHPYPTIFLKSRSQSSDHFFCKYFSMYPKVFKNLAPVPHFIYHIVLATNGHTSKS